MTNSNLLNFVVRIRILTTIFSNHISHSTDYDDLDSFAHFQTITIIKQYQYFGAFQTKFNVYKSFWL